MTAAQALPHHVEPFLTALGAGPLERTGEETWWFEWGNKDGILVVSPEGDIAFELVLAEDSRPDDLREWLGAQPDLVRDWLDIRHDEDLAQLTYQGGIDPDM